tara:strand:- start:45 stop:179 length:135 start_codon:yes stop_codon:yes gene_type:complete
MMMQFKTLDMVLFQSMIKGAVIYGLTFEASDENGVYIITYTGGF